MTKVDDGTLVEVLRERARRTGRRVAYTFLTDGEEHERTLTYAELDAHARRIAVALAARRAAGTPVLLVFEPGLDFVAALFGCFFAGAIAVPVYPPEPRDVAAGLDRLRRIAADAVTSLVLTTAAVRTWLADDLGAETDASPLAWVAVDDLAVGSEEAWSDPGITRGRVAFLQYTSGSTGDPRGVVVTHDNLSSHGAAVGSALSLTPEDVVVSWLPLYHDMGLVGTVLIPMQIGFPSVTMSPLAFLERPMRWVRALARHGGTLSPAPNFAYDLVVRRSTSDERRAVDLGRWRAALNGAEPVRAEVCDRFAEAFAASGFRREAFVPCYGLAEATLMVAGGPTGHGPTRLALEAAALARHRVVPTATSTEGPDVRVVSGCGRAVPGLAVAIVDPDACVPAEPGTVGEIWLAGPQVAAGYWRRDDEAAAIFQARLAAGADRAFLRTGDLGFLHDDVLYVTGRRKDLIVVRGRNHYPQDLEHTAARAHPCARPGGAAAFALDDAGGDGRVAIVQEADAVDAATLAEAARAIGEAVARAHGLRLHAVILIRPRTLPKTSSGKVQRRACREAFVAGRLLAVASWYADGRSDAAPVPPASGRSAAAIEAWLVAAVARVRDVSPDRIRPDDPWVVLGIDSAEAAEVGADLADWLGRAVPMRMLTQHRTLRALAAALHAAEPVALPGAER